ncbi:RagB/SusD family nutrient uptake outer membrane protein [Labilibacter sediminis]|nr:RagB/SusD family nutrient uptake outer membrane protein [Labilibacter sediminis]
MKNTFFNRLLILSLGLLLLVSCEDMLKEKSFSNLTDENFYNTDVHALNAVNGVYSAMITRDAYYTEQGNYGYSGNLMQMDQLSDIGYYGGTNEKYGVNIANATHNENEYVTQNVWMLSYLIINRANNVLANVPGIVMDSTLQQRILGEAKFLRAFSYFNLVRLWGDVPLHVEETVDFEPENIQLGRSSIEDVFEVIISDLEFAEKSLYFKSGSFATDDILLLPEEAYSLISGTEEDGDYVIKQLDQLDNGRATIGAARSLLARVHIFLASMKKHGNVEGYSWVDDYLSYSKTIQYCQRVVNAGNYNLVDSFNELFSTENEFNAENIFEIQHISNEDNGGIWGYWHDRGAIGATAQYALLFDHDVPEGTKLFTDSLTDARLSHTVTLNKADKDPNLRVRKFGTKVGNTPSGTPAHLVFENWTDNFQNPVNFPVIRYADVLLMLAEALNELEGPGRAYDYVNQVRARARNANYNVNATVPTDLYGMTQVEFRKEIWDERKRELGFEGYSFFDLVRTGTFMEKIQDTKTPATGLDVFDPELWDKAQPSVISENVQEHNRLFPIPLRENEIYDLGQNPGY